MSTITLHVLHGIATPSRARQATELCVRAFNSAYAETIGDEANPPMQARYMAREKAERAFLLAMPTLESRASIRAYIACVARAVQLRIFNGKEAQKHLYMAQVALSAQTERRRRK